MKGKTEVNWRSGEGETTQKGFINPNGQRCSGTLSVPGTDHEQYVYKMECENCGFVYGANGTDVHLRKCPECQDGRPGIRYWRRP